MTHWVNFQETITTYGLLATWTCLASVGHLGVLTQNALLLSQHGDPGWSRLNTGDDKPTWEENLRGERARPYGCQQSNAFKPEVIPGISIGDVVFAELDIALLRHRQTKRKIAIYWKAKWNEIEEEMKRKWKKTMNYWLPKMLRVMLKPCLKHSRLAYSQPSPSSSLTEQLHPWTDHPGSQEELNFWMPGITYTRKYKETTPTLAKKRWNPARKPYTKQQRSIPGLTQKMYSQNLTITLTIKQTLVLHQTQENWLHRYSPHERNWHTERLSQRTGWYSQCPIQCSVVTKDSPSDFSDHTWWRSNKQYPNIDDRHIYRGHREIAARTEPAQIHGSRQSSLKSSKAPGLYNCPLSAADIPEISRHWSVLFLIYINDLPEEVHGPVCLFADGTIMYVTMTGGKRCCFPPTRSWLGGKVANEVPSPEMHSPSNYLKQVYENSNYLKQVYENFQLLTSQPYPKVRNW